MEAISGSFSCRAAANAGTASRGRLLLTAVEWLFSSTAWRALRCERQVREVTLGIVSDKEAHLLPGAIPEAIYHQVRIRLLRSPRFGLGTAL